MILLDLHSERYTPTGNASSTGVKNQLGRPNLDVMDVLIRETVQNSWDARLSDTLPVRYDVSIWSMSTEQRQILDNSVFREKPPNLVLERLDTRAFTALAISDRNTKGLGGPTRADQVSSLDGARDFVDFLRNVGTPRDKHLGGGTYGFGKASLYLASCLSTVIVYSRCKVRGKLERRFIVAALGEPFEIKIGDSRGAYTGRHWWGQLADDGVVDPIRGKEAERLARGLGLPDFDGDDTGTTLVVLGPRLPVGDEDRVRSRVQAALLWSFWPKMLSNPENLRTMKFSYSWNGKAFPIPHPKDIAPLSGYAQAMENLKAMMRGEPLPHDGKVCEIRSQRPKQLLGHLSMVRFLRSDLLPRLGLDPDSDSDLSCLWGPETNSHHIALMRNAELVVRYLDSPALPTDMLEYAGVFVCDTEVDDAFARSEPPTHDDWQPRILEDRNERTYVNVALREIKVAVKEFLAPLTANPPRGEAASLGRAATYLGSLIPVIDGGGGGLEPQDVPTDRRESGKRSTRGTKSGSVELQNGQQLAILEGRLAVRFTFRITHADDATATTVQALPEVLINDGASTEREAPRGDDLPLVLRWEGVHGEVSEGGDRLTVSRDQSEVWSALIQVPSNALLRASFIITDGED